MSVPRISRASTARRGDHGALAVRAAHGDSRARPGCILSLSCDGRVGTGEATPLPGYSPDTLDDCQAALEELDVAGIALDDGGLHALLERLPERLPAAAFAIETAFLDLRAQLENRSIAVILAGGRDVARCERCALAGADLLAAALDAERRGIRALKCKIGVADLGDELRDLAALRRAFPALELRVDANGSLASADLDAILRELASLGVAWVEEPCAAADLHRLESSPVAVALDECLRDASARPTIVELARMGRIAALVLKPAVLGGLRRCLEVRDELGAPGIASHLMDGPIALAATAELACALGGERAHGVDLHPGLVGWGGVRVPQLAEAGIRPAPGGLGVAV